MNIHPVRSGWYQLDSADLLHFDVQSKTWGIWFPQQPGVRHVIDEGRTFSGGDYQRHHKLLVMHGPAIRMRTVRWAVACTKDCRRGGVLIRTAILGAPCPPGTCRWHTTRSASAASPKKLARRAVVVQCHATDRMDLPSKAKNYLASSRSARRQYLVKVSKNFRPIERR